MVYFLSHPIQYFSPLLRQLSRRASLQVYYYTGDSPDPGIDKGFGKAVAWDIPLLEGYSFEFLENKKKRTNPGSRLWDVFNPGIPAVIRKSPEKIVLMNGWSYSSDWLVALSSKCFGKKLWLRAENPLNQELKKSRTVRLIKKFLLGKILFGGLTDKCLYIGKESKEFFRYYGVPEHKLIYTPYAVDNDFFHAAWLRLKDQKTTLKEKLGIPTNKKIIIFTGKYIPKKRPMDLLIAAGALQAENYFLVMVGDGELRGEMENYIRQQQLTNVLLTGFVNQSAIPEYYAVGDVFVMCSGLGETWGLAVNEAMNFCLPVIVSDTCGCSPDLVRAGYNGYTFPEGDTDRLTTLIRAATASEETTRKMGEASWEIVQTYSIDAIVENIQQYNVNPA